MRKANKMRFIKWLPLIIVALASIGGFFPESLRAADRCAISVDTILAARDDNKVDSQLKRHIEELQSMFNYTSYRLLGSERLNLSPGQSGMVSLPGDRRLQIIPQKIQGGRADIVLKMMKAERTVFQSQIQLLNGGNLFVGGPKYLNGNLIFKISSKF